MCCTRTRWSRTTAPTWKWATPRGCWTAIWTASCGRSCCAAPATAARSVRDLIERALTEDVGSGDLTTAAVVPEDVLAVARIEQREAGVLAGLDVAAAGFERVDAALVWRGGAGAGRRGAARAR